MRALFQKSERSEGHLFSFYQRALALRGEWALLVQQADDFANIGVAEADIPRVVMQTVSQGKVVGYQGVGVGRPIYEVSIGGQTRRIAVTVSRNGFVVGANPAGR